MKKIDAHVHLTSFLFSQDLLPHPKANPMDGDCIKKCLELMDKHGIDQCLAMVAQGVSILPMENDIVIQMAEALPERIAGVMVGFSQPMEGPWSYDSEKAAEEIENYLKNPIVKGLGELALCALAHMSMDWGEIWDKLRPVFDVLAAHNAPASFHTGGFPQFFVPGSGRTRATRALYYSNPIFIDDIATEYPDVPLIIAHAGVQGFYSFGNYSDMAITVAARNANVYIEGSSVPYEVLLKCVEDPAIGPEKIIFGTDTPAFFQYHKHPSTGEYYPSYGKTGPGPETPDHYVVDLENIDRLPITAEQKDMILGGTIARLIGDKKE